MVDIKSKVQEVLESRKNVNNLVDIIARLDTGEKTDVLMAAVQGLKRVFVAALEKGEVGKEGEVEEGADGKLKSWMAERLQESSKKLASLLHHPKTSVSSLVLAAITALLKAAWLSSGETNKWGQVHCSVSIKCLSYTNFLSTRWKSKCFTTSCSLSAAQSETPKLLLFEHTNCLSSLM